MQVATPVDSIHSRTSPSSRRARLGPRLQSWVPSPALGPCHKPESGGGHPVPLFSSLACADPSLLIWSRMAGSLPRGLPAGLLPLPAHRGQVPFLSFTRRTALRRPFLAGYNGVLICLYPVPSRLHPVCPTQPQGGWARPPNAGKVARTQLVNIHQTLSLFEIEKYT